MKPLLSTMVRLPRRIALTIFPFVLLISSLSLHAQHRFCGTRSAERASMEKEAFSGSIETYTGAFLPFKGRIRGLVTFVQMRNDDVKDPSWPNGQMPLWSASYVERLQRYFADMSGGELQLQLDVHPELMITNSTEEGYLHWGQSFGDAIKEQIDSLDLRMDFSLYDNWDSEGQPYDVKECPDGKVDLLIVVFRSISRSEFLPFSGVSDLGFAGHHFVDGALDRYFYGGSGEWNDAGASGLTISYLPGWKAVMNAEFAFKVTVHEFGHKLFGGSHPADLYGKLGIMGRSSNGYAMSSFEKHLAGYTEFAVLNPGRDTVITLHDYLTQDQAVLLPIPQHSRTYYAFEFRGKFSEWDSAPVEGLYIYRIHDSWSKSQKRVLVVSAEGSYDWALNDSTGTVYPVRPRSVGGYSRLQQIPIENKVYWAEGWEGDERMAFRMSSSELAVLKNPSPDYLFGSDTINTGLRIRLLAMTDSSATVRISYQAPEILDTDVPLIAESEALSLPFPHPLLAGGSNGTVHFSLARASQVNLSLYDALGRRIRVLDEGWRDGGMHQAAVPVENLAPAAYSLVLETATQRHTRIILITQ